MGEGSERKWNFVAYGTSTDLENNGYSGSVEDNTLSVWSLHGRGKLVPASTDGLAFYYTVLNAETENFVLSADLEVESWTYSNGQDGFGLMAADAVGENGSEVSFWNNSYMASVTRVDYLYDRERQCVSDVGEKYFMKLGVGAQEKKGVTPRAVEEGTEIQGFQSTMYTLETTAPRLGLAPGTYNLVGGYTNDPHKMRDAARLTSFRLSLRRMNGGYEVGYTDQEGITVTRKFYHGENGDELTRLDREHICVGFFASRNIRMAVRNVELKIVNPREDESIGEHPLKMVPPECSVLSASVANRETYRLVCAGNADGRLTVEDETGKRLVCRKVRAGERCLVETGLHRGENPFTVSFAPEEGYQPSLYERLSSYEVCSLRFVVTYQVNEGEQIYIGPSGRAQGAGTREDPMDIYTAVGGAAVGQHLTLLPGRYLLDRTVRVERGISGTKERPIVLAAEEGERPVLDFLGRCMGMALGGDYWHYRGFDVTNTGRAEGGVRLTGSHNVVERVNIYRNGNTGFQISCSMPGDDREDWPSDNLVKNCTSYLNADPGYTDSDGFACKITVGEGNVFDGCISAYNADDGFDLFAKVEKGVTGSVLIKNCLAFRNGYVLDEEGREIHVGLGNGFKLGGSSLPCGHRLENSIAFWNGEKGVDSNSCPNDRVSRVTSFDNDSHNVALFTTDAKETDFAAEGVLSFRTKGNVPDVVEPRGTQERSALLGENNYYGNGSVSENSLGRRVSADWFADLDADRAIHGGIRRDREGRIDMGGFLSLTEEAPVSAGARLDQKD